MPVKSLNTILLPRIKRGRQPIATPERPRLAGPRKASYCLARTARPMRLAPPKSVEPNDFAEDYEQLVSALCTAAKFGTTTPLEREYARLRSRLLAGRRALAARLNSYPKRVMVSGGRELAPSDAVAHVLKPRSLAEMLSKDAGGLIDCVSRVSEAVFVTCFV